MQRPVADRPENLAQASEKAQNRLGIWPKAGPGAWEVRDSARILLKTLETPCLDGAPSSRVGLTLCERIGCGHVFGLFGRETNIPLALMLVRMAFRPINGTRS
jgi:hypothetical protein